uniref:Uncharacterized protein n=1 Tax=Anopheles maculatus TaxID=74869 RepID=A0A182T751_9DIPT
MAIIRPRANRPRRNARNVGPPSAEVLPRRRLMRNQHQRVYRGRLQAGTLPPFRPGRTRRDRQPPTAEDIERRRANRREREHRRRQEEADRRRNLSTEHRSQPSNTAEDEAETMQVELAREDVATLIRSPNGAPNNGEKVNNRPAHVTESQQPAPAPATAADDNGQSEHSSQRAQIGRTSINTATAADRQC